MPPRPLASFRRVGNAVSDDGGPLLRRMADVVFQLLVLGWAAYFLVWILRELYIVVIPFGIALLFTALLRPAVKRLRARGMKPAFATWLTIIVFWVVVGGVVYGAALRASADWPTLTDEATNTIDNLRDYAVKHLGFKGGTITQWSDQATTYLKNHRTAVAGGALSGAKLIAEGASGAVLAFFIGFFLMYDGEGIFSWVVGFFRPAAQRRLRLAGGSAWRALSGYIRGTLIVALFHGTVMAIALYVMGVPLAVPLAILVAFGSLIPLVGAIVFGGLAVLVALVTKGWLLAVILVGVLVIENQAEAHILQPFVVGRSVHLHPLAIALVLTIGTVWGGLWGALFAVPLTAALWAAYSAVSETRESSWESPP